MTPPGGNPLSPVAYDALQGSMRKGNHQPRKMMEMALRANLEGKMSELAKGWMDEFGGS